MQLSKYEPSAQRIFVESQKVAKGRQHQIIEPEHLLYALLSADALVSILGQIKAERTELLRAIEIELVKLPRIVNAPTYLSPRFLQVCGQAEVLATVLGQERVSPLHLLMALAQGDDTHPTPASSLLRRYKITKERLQALSAQDSKRPALPTSGEVSVEAGILSRFTRNLTALAREKKLDPVFGRDLETSRVIQVLARRHKNNPILVGDPGVGKNAIINGLAARMASGDVPAVLKGKELLALDIGAVLAGTTLRGQFEERLKTLLSELREAGGQILLFIDEIHVLVGAGGEGASDAANLLKPALARGEIQALGTTTPESYRSRLERDAALERRFQAIWISEPTQEEALQILRGLKAKYEAFHSVRIEDEALIAAVHLGLRYLSESSLPDKAIDLIDEAAARVRIAMDSVPSEIDEIERRLVRLKIEVEALAREKSTGNAELDRLRTLIEADERNASQLHQHWEQELALVQSISALETGISLAEKECAEAERAQEVSKAAELRYDKIEKLRESSSEKAAELKAMQEHKRLVREQVLAEDVAEVVADITGIPVKKMMQSERDKLVHMEDRISKRIVGQHEAVQRVANSIRRSRAGLSDPGRPVGSFLFLGPTGVGKTELAKCLGDFLFDDEKAVIRFDMSEFMEKHTVARMIGPPPGYQGAEEGGQLTEAVRRRPYSVLLFDEVEKAHPDVLNILLQILDDGRLTDSRGRLIDFKNTVIIMTTNLGSKYLIELGLENLVISNETKQDIRQEVLEHFRPEFVNRIDEIVIFHGLSRANIESIADIQLAHLDRLLSAESLRLVMDDDAKQALVDAGFEPAFGARPLRRAIQRLIQDPLSLALLEHKFRAGDRIHCRLKEPKQEASFEFVAER